MSLDAQIEELRAELKASSNTRECRQIARELECVLARRSLLEGLLPAAQELRP